MCDAENITLASRLPQWLWVGEHYPDVSCTLVPKTCASLAGSFIHLVVCLMTGPKPLPKRAFHLVRSRASSFKWEYPLLSLRSSSSFLCLLSHLPVTSIPPFIFPSITCFSRQFLRKMWPILLAFHLRISCRVFLCCLTLSNTSSFLTFGQINKRKFILKSKVPRKQVQAAQQHKTRARHRDIMSIWVAVCMNATLVQNTGSNCLTPWTNWVPLAQGREH